MSKTPAPFGKMERVWSCRGQIRQWNRLLLLNSLAYFFQRGDGNTWNKTVLVMINSNWQSASGWEGKRQWCRLWIPGEHMLAKRESGLPSYRNTGLLLPMFLSCSWEAANINSMQIYSFLSVAIISFNIHGPQDCGLDLACGYQWTRANRKDARNI